MKLISPLCYTALILSGSVYAYEESSNETLKFEATPYKNQTVHCENKNNIKPLNSDFKLLDYSAMSSDNGDRYILATLQNTSSGQRIFNHQHVIAIFGDCTREAPIKIEQKFEAKETLALQLYFGKNKYPILKVVDSQ